MRSELNVKQSVGLRMEASEFRPRGRVRVEHWRAGKLLNVIEVPNGITVEGKNHILDVQFHAATQLTTWYLGLIDNANYTALSENDTYDAINQAGNGWDEFADYTDENNASSAVTRPAWVEGAASAKSITSSSNSIFKITAGGTVKGVLVAAGANAQTKSDHTASGNILWATALFTGDQPVVIDDELRVTYTVST